VSKQTEELPVVLEKQIPIGEPSSAFGAALEVERSRAGSSRIAYPASAELLIQLPASFRSKCVQFPLDLVQLVPSIPL
jgi:hypothetical protein